jgi:hypothetical protein
MTRERIAVSSINPSILVGSHFKFGKGVNKKKDAILYVQNLDQYRLTPKI